MQKKNQEKLRRLNRSQVGVKVNETIYAIELVAEVGGKRRNKAYAKVALLEVSLANQEESPAIVPQHVAQQRL